MIEYQKAIADRMMETSTIPQQMEVAAKFRKQAYEQFYSQYKCEFCDSTDTVKYPAEGRGDVYLCEECRSRSND